MRFIQWFTFQRHIIIDLMSILLINYNHQSGQYRREMLILCYRLNTSEGVISQHLHSINLDESVCSCTRHIVISQLTVKWTHHTIHYTIRKLKSNSQRESHPK